MIDIETYINNAEDSGSMFNMIPFVVCLVGNLYQMSVEIREYPCKETGKTKKEYRQCTTLVRNIAQTFVGFKPGECIRKLVKYLMDNNFVYVSTDYSKLEGQDRKGTQLRVFNKIFAHNGFNFDYKYLFEEL